MPTLTMPNWVTLLIAALEIAILIKVCWAIPKQDGRWLRGFPLFVLMSGILLGFLLLIDYGEWKEGHATLGDSRRATAVLEFCDFLDEASLDLQNQDCIAAVEVLRLQYQALSESLVMHAGVPLPAFPSSSSDCEGGLLQLVERCRIEALRVELRPEFEHNGRVGAYFRDRLFDGD